MDVKTLCPVCGQTLAVRIYSDRSVGINFDYDVLETGTNCTCDADEQLVADAQFDKLQKEFQHLV